MGSNQSVAGASKLVPLTDHSQGVVCHFCGGKCAAASQRYLAYGGLEEREKLLDGLSATQRFTTRSVLTAFHTLEDENTPPPFVNNCRRCGSASCLLCAQVLMVTALDHFPQAAAAGILAHAHRGVLLACDQCRPALRKRATRLMQEAHVRTCDREEDPDDDGFVVVRTCAPPPSSPTSAPDDLGTLRRDEVVELLQQDPQNGALWFRMASLVPLHRGVSLALNDDDATKTYSTLCCLGKAMMCDPSNPAYILQLAYHMSMVTPVTIFGRPFTSIDMALLAVERFPKNPMAWMCVAACTRERHVAVHGVDMSRAELLQRAVDLAPDDLKVLYPCAFLLCRVTGTLVHQGRTRTRRELFGEFLAEPPLTRSLDEHVEAFFGPLFPVQVIMDVCLQHPDDPRVLARNAVYTVDRGAAPLGAGAFGTVYPATRKDPSTGKAQRLAVKVAEDHLGERPTLCDSTELLLSTAHVLRGVIVMAEHVMRRPNEGKMYTFMDRAREGSAQAYLMRLGGRMHEPHLRQAIMDLGHALELLHYHGVVHQDLKPANILVFGGEVMKLTDFGVSTVSHCCAAPAVVGGTARYMPPEALRDGAVGPAGDVWSFALTIVELASGRLPVPDPRHRPAEGVAPPWRPYIPDHLSNSLRDVLTRMTTYDPAARPTMRNVLSMPYFTDIDLPEDVESVEDYRANVSRPGIPEEDSGEGDTSSANGLTTMRTTIRST